jgi:MerR family transcriptional regulator, light-induced transcriptional regulator
VVDMRRLKTSEAAALLNVSPNTLRAWERRFGFPRPQRSRGRHRLYTHDELASLRDALQEGLSISSAVSRAREGLAADTNSLVGALLSFRHERADFAIEATLALRSVERSTAQILLPSLDEIVRLKGPDSAAWAFAVRWSSDWLARTARLAPPPLRPVSILLGDASRDELDPDAPHIRALELMCLRGGVRVLTLSVRGIAGIADVLSRDQPDLVVVAGSSVDNDTVARWAYAIRHAMGTFPLAVYRRGEPQTSRVTILPRGALEASRRILELTNARQASRPDSTAPHALHRTGDTTLVRVAG